VHFGQLPEELRRKAEAVARVDAALIAGTCAGRSLEEILQDGIRMYAETGYPEEWKLHHQGGLAGYEPREIVARPGETAQAADNQAFAWNPSITGTKSEDTILVGAEGSTVLTEIEDWPMLSLVINGQEYRRPAILEIE
jgi:antitoxin VapB